MIAEGWHQPGSSNFSHYFRDGMALCLKYFAEADFVKSQPTNACKVCVKRKSELRS
jgi:hypothetical protein